MDQKSGDGESPWASPRENAAVTPPPTVFESMRRGAKTGFRCVSYVIGPIAIVVSIAGLVVAAFVAGSGRGGVATTLLPGKFGFVSWAVGFFFVCGLWGLILGAAIGLVGAVIR